MSASKLSFQNSVSKPSFPNSALQTQLDASDPVAHHIIHIDSELSMKHVRQEANQQSSDLAKQIEKARANQQETADLETMQGLVVADISGLMEKLDKLREPPQAPAKAAALAGKQDSWVQNIALGSASESDTKLVAPTGSSSCQMVHGSTVLQLQLA